MHSVQQGDLQLDEGQMRHDGEPSNGQTIFTLAFTGAPGSARNITAATSYVWSNSGHYCHVKAGSSSR